MQTMNIIPGKILAEKILDLVKKEIDEKSIKPLLKIYYIGDDPESAKYIEKKVNRGKNVGIQVIVQKFPDNVEISDLTRTLINDGIDSSIDGMIIQLPVKNPKIKDLFELIPVNKDVDGLNPLSLGLLWQGNEYVLIPATVKAIIKSIEYVANESGLNLRSFLEGKNCLVINRSLIIGKPVASILLNNDGTVIMAHSKTKNIQDLILKSDVIIAATGKAGFLNNYKFSPNTLIIDSGFSLVDGKILGDVILDDKFGENISYISPVPGGIGPMGVACLLENTLLASKSKES